MDPQDAQPAAQQVWPATAIQAISSIASRRIMEADADAQSAPAAAGMPSVGVVRPSEGSQDHDLFDAVLQQMFAVAASLQAAAQRIGSDDPASRRLAALAGDLDVAIALLRSTVFEDGAFSTGWIEARRSALRAS
jgi:hypothetical protein